METLWFSLFLKRKEEEFSRLTASEFLSLLRSKSKQVITEGELVELVKKKKKLKVKLGIDPTGAELHLGHALPVMLLRLFQRRGHEVNLVLGDFTAQIGDPSGQTEKRVELLARDVGRNMKTYTDQISPLLDLGHTKIHCNSAWLGKMKLAEYLRVLSGVSFGAIAQREDFRQRIKSGVGVTLREANYSSLMAIDSLHLKADIEVGGIDQLLNFMQTREIMGWVGVRPETVLLVPLLEGTAGDGRKMSKSFGNYVALHDTPDNQFGLIMSIPDKLILSYFVSFGDIYDYEIHDLDSYITQRPFEAKKELGMFIVALLRGEKAAQKAREDFERRFAKKEYKYEDAIKVTMKLPSAALEALVEAFRGEYSKTKIRTLIQQGGVRKVSDKTEKSLAETDIIEGGDLVKVGKLHLFRFLKK